VSAFRVKLGTDDLNCVDVPLNPTHSVDLRVVFVFPSMFKTFSVSFLSEDLFSTLSYNSLELWYAGCIQILESHGIRPRSWQVMERHRK